MDVPIQRRLTRGFTRLFIGGLAGVMVATLMGGCARHLDAPEQIVDLPHTDYRVEQNLQYSPPDWPQALYADLYLPESAGPHPAVLMVHGGGWSGRSRSDMENASETLASHGMAVLNIDYRFAPEYHFPAQLHDLQQAMHWLHDHAAEYGIDRDRIAAFGYSAGAHLVSLMALVATDPDATLSEPYGGPETSVRAVVSGGTPSDLRKFNSGKLVRQFIGGTMDEMPEAYASASPVTHITPAAPPFFLFHGTWDDLVPPDHATGFQAALASAGIPTELIMLPYRGHIMTFLSMRWQLDEAMQFLAQRGALFKSDQPAEE